MAEETRAVRTVETGERKDRILIVEDEDNARKGYEQLLQRWGYEVVGVGSAEEALARFSNFQPDTLIADVELPGMNGLDLLQQLGEDLRHVPAIIITGKGSEERAVAAIEAGAFWYIEKPLKGPVLRALLDRALSKARDAQNLAVLQKQLRDAGRLGELVGGSKPMQEVMRVIEMAGPSSASVLITGETGSGKEIVARTIHKLSPRAAAPFVAINCSAIPETLMESEIFGHERGAFTGAAERRIGCFELADGGTLLLDEIGEMPAPTQAKLLRVLEDRKVRRLGSKTETPVDVRVLAATNKDPEQAVAGGQLRQDLYFRLNVFHIHLPPLREHKEDIPLLTEHMLRDINAKHGKNVRGIGAEVMDIFMSHTWPGNIRELRNVLERAAIMSEKDLITRSSLPGEFGKLPSRSPSDLSGIKFPVGTTVDAMERELILQTLQATGNNKTRAAELLGVSLKTLHNKLKEYGSEKTEAES
ncbi:MAG TPA: sigma-54 dependent transcriptional regulator [Candidatus Sulfotelmatobacter sp.]|jgi:DNA-binding NtrC family response regulator|nr:sigma-54 dependent transcriptional regulator [Candidatus Sulfotelmatobacter sp.]